MDSYRTTCLLVISLSSTAISALYVLAHWILTKISELSTDISPHFTVKKSKTGVAKNHFQTQDMKDPSPYSHYSILYCFRQNSLPSFLWQIFIVLSVIKGMIWDLLPKVKEIEENNRMGD